MRKLLLAAGLAALAAGCGGGGSHVAHYSNADQIVTKLNTSGFRVTGAQFDPGEHWSGIRTELDLTVAGHLGEPLGVDMFANPDTTKVWRGLSKSAGGIAVVGDVWAVSLPTDTNGDRRWSNTVVARVARALGGQVVR